MKINKVLILSADFYPNNTGFSNATINLVKAIKKNCNDIEIYVFTDVNLRGYKEIKYAHVIRYSNKFNNNIKIFRILNNILKYVYLKKYIISNKIRFILLETNTFTVLQNLLCKKFRNILSVRIHSTVDTEVLMYYKKSILGKLSSKMNLNFMKNVKYIISTNIYHQNFIKEIMFNKNEYTIWNNKQYFILPNTVDVSEYNDLYKSNIKCAEYILTLGKLSFNGYVQKGLQDILKAIYILKTKNEIPVNFKLKLIGNGEKRDDLILYAKKLNIYEYIDFIKSTTHYETLKLIKSCKAVILPSRYEGQSMFITETLSLGKPVIITEHNGMEDMVKHGVNGFKVKKGDYISISNYIKKIYMFSNEELYDMGKASRSIFINKFSDKIIYKNFLDILNLVNAEN